MGNNAYAVYPDGSAILTDLAGNRRIVGGVVDLGAYEYQTGVSPIDPLAAPENVAASSAGANRHQVRWNAVAGAVEYSLAYSTNKTTWTTVAATDTAYTVTGLSYRTTVYYKVMAVGDGVTHDNSVDSAIASLYVCPMDIDGDGRVGPADRSALSAAWMAGLSSAKWDARADIDGDGRVGPTDRNFLSLNWMKSASSSSLAYPEAAADLPVPDAVFDEIFASPWE